MAPKERAINYRHIYALMKAAKLGDVLLTRSKGELTNWLIPGEYKHAALFAGENTVIEAVGAGVREVYLEDFCASKDKILLLRPMINSPEMAVIRAKRLVGKPYDYGFEPNEKAFYCAELITYVYNNSNFTNRTTLGVLTTLPDDFRLATSKFVQVTEQPCPSVS